MSYILLVAHLSKQYKKKGEETIFQLPEQFEELTAIYNTIQKTARNTPRKR